MNKKIFTLLLFISTTHLLFAQQTIRRQYDFSPVVSVNLYLLKSDTTIPHGKYVQFFRGKRWLEGEYDNGIKIGKWTRYYESGETMVQGSYIDGKPDGKWYRYNSDGEILAEVEYDNGFPIGVWKGFYNDKKHRKSAEFLYSDSILTQGILYDEKERVRYNINQKIIGDDNFQTISLYYKNSKIFTYDELVNGMQEGSSIIYHDNGSRWEEMEYRNGLLWNVVQLRTHNGQPRVTGGFKNGNGNLRRYYPDGILYHSQDYKDGLKHGKGNYFFTSGKIRSNEEYKYGFRVGKWEIYNKYYNLISEIIYDSVNIGNTKTTVHEKGGDIEYETTYQEDGSIVSKEKHYNQYGEVIGEVEFDENSNKTSQKTYSSVSGKVTSIGETDDQDSSFTLSRFNQLGQIEETLKLRVPNEKHARIVAQSPLEGWYTIYSNSNSGWNIYNSVGKFIMGSRNITYYTPPLPGMELPAHRAIHEEYMRYYADLNYEYRPRTRWPRFPYENGDEKFYFENYNILIQKAKELNQKGVIVVQFSVNELGMLGDYEIISGMSPEMNYEAIQTLKKMPAWTPPSYCGMPITMFVVKQFDLTYED